MLGECWLRPFQDPVIERQKLPELVCQVFTVSLFLLETLPANGSPEGAAIVDRCPHQLPCLCTQCSVLPTFSVAGNELGNWARNRISKFELLGI